MWLVVGLGNPGSKYELNRHNIGFLAVEEIARKLGSSVWTKKFRGELCEGNFKSERIYFLKPQTYMNLSGESVAAAARFYKIPPENIIVIHDDIDIANGKLRVKQGGGNGGHNGLKSLDAHIGVNYIRIRIGVGRPEHSGQVADFVLNDFSKEDFFTQEKIIKKISEHLHLLLEGKMFEFNNEVNRI